MAHKDHETIVLKDSEVNSASDISTLYFFPDSDPDEAQINESDDEIGEDGATDATFFKNEPHFII
jgi:hypothetical protein